MTIPVSLARRRLAPVSSLDMVRWWPALAATSLAAAVALSRLPIRGRYLFNWDSLQFALGVRHFDLAAHRPHPPGYIGYIVAGRVLHYGLGLDVNGSLVGLSIVAEAATVAGVFLVARRRSGEFAGWAAALLLLSSPLFWLYGETALTYALEPGMALLAFVLLTRALSRRGRGLVLAATVVGLEGAVRPSAEFFLLPMLGFAAWRCWQADAGGLRVAGAGIALVGATAAWLGPLLALSGGPAAYLDASSQLAARVSVSSAVWRAGLPALLSNTRSVLDGVLMAAGGVVVFLLAAPLVVRLEPRTRPAPRRLSIPTRDDTMMLLLWVLPAFSVYLLVHIGQLAYVLFALPALLLLAGPSLETAAAAVVGAGRRFTAPATASVLLGSCVLVSVLFHVAAPESLASQVGRRDARVAALAAALSRDDPAGTLIIADPEGPSSYRTAMYYFDSFPVVALGRDRHGRAGEMFSNRGGAPEYDLRRFEHSGPLNLPTDVTAVILDPEVLPNIGDGWVLGAARLSPGVSVWTVPLRSDDPPVRMGERIFLLGSDCPCRSPFHGRPVAHKGAHL